MKKVIHRGVALACAGVFFASSSCATIFTGTKDRITFESVPSGATVYVDGYKIGKTPVTHKVKRDISGQDFEMKLDGYENERRELETKFNAVAILNLASILGWGIDVLTGSVIKADRKMYEIELTPKAAPAQEPTTM